MSQAGEGERTAGNGVAAGSKGLETLAKKAKAVRKKGPPPVHLWNPAYCGELDIRIKRDGGWWYQGTPINRVSLVRLFGSILRKDEDGATYLVTPAEKIRITVEDAPFIGVDVIADGASREARIQVETNHGDRATLGPEHPLRLLRDAETGAPAPYILVRGRLEARLDRKSFFRLADLAEIEQRPEGRRLGVWSDGAFFALADDAELAEIDSAATAAT